jgi:hypothetical protein
MSLFLSWREKIMGRVKQLFEEMWEEKLLADEKHFTSSSGSSKAQMELFPEDQALAQYQKEFEEWLDAYEKSFADEEGKLP